MNILRWLSILIIVMFVNYSSAFAGKNQIPTISIGGIISEELVGNDAYNRINRQAAFRDHLTTELVRKYNCRVLSRSRGYEVAREGIIQQLSSISQLEVSPNRIAAADYYIAAHYAPALKARKLRGYVFCENISDISEVAETNAVFAADNLQEAPAKMAEVIANMLSLKEKEITKHNTDISVKNKRIWTVLPFTRLDILSKNIKKEDLAIQVEQELQQNKDIILVDRLAFNKVLQEHIHASVDGINCLDMARLVNADIIVLGTVVRQDKNKYRIDIQIADSHTGVILDAHTDICTYDRLSTVARRLARELDASIKPYKISISSAAARKKEAGMFLSSKYYPVQVYWGILEKRGIWEAVVDGAEAAYFLAHDDPAIRYKTAHRIYRYLYHFNKINSLGDSPITDRAVWFVDEVLRSYKHSSNTPYPLLMRAEAFSCINEADKALQLLEKHERLYPGEELKRVLVLKANCYIQQNKIREADIILEKIIKRFGEDKLTSNIIEKIKNNPFFVKKSEKDQYVILEKMMYSPGLIIKYKDLEKYLDLALKIDGPKRIFEIINDEKNNGGFVDTSNFIFLWYQGLAYEELGEKEKAVEKYMMLLKAIKTHKKNDIHLFPGLKKYIIKSREKIKRLENETGTIKLDWKTAAQVRTFPADQKICVIPVGAIPTNIISGTAQKLGNYFGTEVSVLPTVSVPKKLLPTGSRLRRKAYRLKPLALIKGVLSEAEFPSDTVFALFITKEQFDNKSGFEHSMTTICSPGYFNAKCPDNPIIVSCAKQLKRNNNHDLIARDMAWKAIVTFRSLYKGKEKYSFGYRIMPCREFPCVNSRRPAQNDGHRLPLLMCPECQKDYQKADFKQIQRKLQNNLKMVDQEL